MRDYEVEIWAPDFDDVKLDTIILFESSWGQHLDLPVRARVRCDEALRTRRHDESDQVVGSATPSRDRGPSQR